MSGSADDRGLVPTFEGITNAESIGDWHPPFPVDLHLVTERDEDYWKRYKTTPKAFVSLETMHAIWKSASPVGESGWITSLRITPKTGQDLGALSAAFSKSLTNKLKPEDSGLVFRPIRRIVLSSTSGTTDFGQLFMCMSFFIVLSGAILSAMLMRLSTEQRASETGLMLACGFKPSTATMVIFGQGALLSLAGTVLGVPLGVLYALGITEALKTRWTDAIGGSPIWLHVTPASLAIGVVSGLAVGLISMLWSTLGLRKKGVLQLLSGWQSAGVLKSANSGRLTTIGLYGCLGLAVAVFVLTGGGSSGARESAYFGGGACLLAAGIFGVSIILQRVMRFKLSSPTLGGLAVRSAAANRARSLLTVGLLATAGFIIIAVAANTRDFSKIDYTRLDSGTGGFALRAVSSIPIYYDLGSSIGREKLGFSTEDEKVFRGVHVISLKMSPGEDISCLNLAKPSVPRVIAVSADLIAHKGFEILTDKPNRDPWDLLRPGSTGDVPAFGDSASVEWNLHSGLGQVYMSASGDLMRFAGLLNQSIFAGELLVPEDRFMQVYPSVDAPTYFLIETPKGQESSVALALRKHLGRMGLDVKTTRELLNSYIGVQNTYLSMFLALGGLGVMLGTVGLVAVLLRSALERRREFAVMLAQGFTRESIFMLLLIENAGLLIVGMLIGTVSALIAVVPELSRADTRMNWSAVALVFAGILAVGLASCAIAARSVARGLVIDALRGE